MNPRIVKINEKLFFKASKSLKLLDILKFTFNKNQDAFIQIIDISSDDSIDDYLDNQNYEIDNIEPDALSSFHFSLPHLCWLPHGDNDQNPAYNQNGDYIVLNEKEISELIKKEEDKEKIGIFQRRQYNSNTDKPSLTIVSGANSSGKTLFLKKYSLEQANIRPTIIICSDSMESQYLDIVAKSYKFGKDLFYPPVPSPLYDTENHFDLTINSLFREYPFSPHMKSRMNKVLKEKFPNTKLLGNNEFKILHDSVQVDDSALKARFIHLSNYIGSPFLGDQIVTNFNHYKKHFLITFDSPETGNLLLNCLNSIKSTYISVIIDEAQHFLQNGLNSGFDFLVKRHSFVYLALATNQFSNLPKDCIQACSNFILGSGVDFPRYLDTKLRFDMNLLEQVYNNISRFNSLFNHHFLLWGQITNNFFFIDKINPEYTGNDIYSIIQMDQDHTVRFKKLSSVNRFNSGHYFIDVFCLNEFTKIKEIITLSALSIDSLNYKMNYYMLNKVKENDLLIFKGLLRTNFVKNGDYVFRIVKNTRLFHDSQL